MICRSAWQTALPVPRRAPPQSSKAARIARSPQAPAAKLQPARASTFSTFNPGRSADNQQQSATQHPGRNQHYHRKGDHHCHKRAIQDGANLPSPQAIPRAASGSRFRDGAVTLAPSTTEQKTTQQDAANCEHAHPAIEFDLLRPRHDCRRTERHKRADPTAGRITELPAVPRKAPTARSK